MLVLTRKLMERLYIGEEICVTVVRLEGGQVRLGIEAPRHVRVVRGELTPLAAGPESPADRPSEGAREFRTPPTAPHGSGIRRRAPSR